MYHLQMFMVPQNIINRKYFLYDLMIEQWQICLNYHYGMGALPLKKRIKRDKTAYARGLRYR